MKIKNYINLMERSKSYKSAVLLLMLFILLLEVNAATIKYAEEFYMLYAKTSSEVSNNIVRNIVYLQRSLQTPHSPVVQALCIIKTQEQYIRYKYLFRMHVNGLITRSYIQLASRYDKENIYFFNYLYRNEIKESLDYARYYYELAQIYWGETRKEMFNAQKYQKHKIPLDSWEDEYFKIISGKWDYDKMLQQRLQWIAEKTGDITKWADQFYPSKN